MLTYNTFLNQKTIFYQMASKLIYSGFFLRKSKETYKVAVTNFSIKLVFIFRLTLVRLY